MTASEKTTKALEQALEALNMAIDITDTGLVDFKKHGVTSDKDIDKKLSTAASELSEALAEQQAPVQKRPQNCGTGYCSCIECPYEQPAQQAEQQAQQEPVAWLFPDRTWTEIKAMANDHPPSVAVYTTAPPQRQPLTPYQEQQIIEQESWGPDAITLNAQLLRTIRRTQAAHGITGKGGEA